MKRKYNLALVPQTKADEIVRLAQKFSGLSDRYLLGENSYPHVTLYQFESEENAVDATWFRISAAWEEKPITLEFHKFSCITFDDIIYWISLLPNQGDVLHKMHHSIAEMIGLPIKESFNPHMTLINSKNKDYEKGVLRLAPSYRPIADTFILCQGRADEVGQVTEVLYRQEAIKRNSCSAC